MNDLERTLLALGRELDVPMSPDLSGRVESLLGTRPSPRLLTRRRATLAVALAVLAALAATLAIPQARSALLRVLQLGGARIELVDELPPVPPGGDLGLALGERVRLAEARRRAGFDLQELRTPPDRVYLGGRGTVWFLYGTPRSVRLLVAQTPRSRVDPELLLSKLVAPGTQVESVTVRGSPGVLLTGSPHLLLLLDENGFIVEESARLARDVLLWEERGVAFRLEGELGRERALELAAALR
jgi:hypothetical protein